MISALLLPLFSPGARAQSLIGDGVICHDVNLRACGTNDSSEIVGDGVEFNQGGIVQVDVASNSITFANGTGSQQSNGGTFITTISDLDCDVPGTIVGFEFFVDGITRGGVPLTSADVSFTDDSVTFNWTSSVWAVGSFATVTLITSPPGPATFEQCVDAFESQFGDYFTNLEGTRNMTQCTQIKGKEGETSATVVSDNAENASLQITFGGVARGKQCGVTQRGQFATVLPQPGFGGLLSGQDASQWKKYLTGDGCGLIFTDPTSRTVFLTSKFFTGDLVTEAKNLGIKGKLRPGLVAADKICNKLAEDAGVPGGTYKAWLSGPTGSPSTRFEQANVPYELVNGDKVVDDYADLVDGSLDHRIDRTETGVFNTGQGVWTGTQGDGQASGVDCNGWTSDSPGDSGAFGFSDEITGGGWTRRVSGGGTGPCDATRRMYCFEQK